MLRGMAGGCVQTGKQTARMVGRMAALTRILKRYRQQHHDLPRGPLQRPKVPPPCSLFFQQLQAPLTEGLPTPRFACLDRLVVCCAALCAGSRPLCSPLHLCKHHLCCQDEPQVWTPPSIQGLAFCFTPYDCNPFMTCHWILCNM